MNMFRSIFLDKSPEGVSVSLATLSKDQLPDNGVLVRVHYSGLNYKDALAVTGSGTIVRSWPLIPGIDLAGTVLESESEAFAPGHEVVVTGWGVGERHWGGLAQLANVRPEWATRKPEGLSLRQTMEIGTAGLTAMLCVMALESHGVRPDDGEVLVTGASGGVGGFATAILAHLGYRVVASTGRAENSDYLRSLGAASVVGREEVLGDLKRPLQSQRWSGAVDTVGGTTLAQTLAAVRYGGSVAACGLAGSSDLPTTVFPFILRKVSLLGVDSVECPQPTRDEAWRRLGEIVPKTPASMIAHTAGLDEVPALARDLLEGKIRGRVVVDLTRD